MPMSDEQMMSPVPEEDPVEMGDDEMGMENELPEEGDDSTMSIINQLSDEDKESVRAYAESMLKKNGGNDSEGNEESMPEDGEEMAPAVPEGKTFTKKQLKEEFGVKVQKDNTIKNTPQPKQKKINKNNPFNPPMFS
jgi:hypothetical protein